MRLSLMFSLALVAAGCSFPTGEFTLRPGPVTDSGPPDTGGADVRLDAADADALDAQDAPDVPSPDVSDSGGDTSDGASRCRTNTDCSGTTPVCDTTSGRCVECTPGPSDQCPAGSYCGTGNVCMRGCRASTDCPSGGTCDTATHRCVCTTDTNCGAGTRCCSGACVDVGTDAANCGACGTACPSGGACCGGTCAAVMTEVANCGRCGAVCDPTNATPVCTAGACGVASCDTGYGDCDSNAANGCETSTQSDPGNCGTCGTRCPTGTNATAVCSAGTCGLTCNPGYGDCDGMAANGCETDLRTSGDHCGRCGTRCTAGANAMASCTAGACVVTCNTGYGDCDEDATTGCETNTATSLTHCGGCGVACAFANATATCTAGTCRFGACNAGFRDCNSTQTDGCEQNVLTDSANCGACRTPCSAGLVCSAGACRSTCTPAPLMTCSGTCVDTSSSMSNCGGCGRVCGTANATAACTSSACRLSCNTGFADCDGMSSNGCEQNVNADVRNCGGCGAACSTANGTPTCSSGACRITCNSGFADCNADADDGCETSTTTVTNCGACGRACTVANGVGSCTTGACAVGLCNAGYDNCDANAANGCETSLLTNNANCGRCGTRCATGQVCSAGTCSTVCRSPTTLCGTSCVNLQTDESNCGACGRTCLLRLSCIAGRCTYPPPSNDTCAGATEINLSAGSRIDLTAATTYALHDLNSPCNGTGGNDVFFRFVLTRREFVYADTFGATWDTRLFFASSCTAPMTTSNTSGDAVCSDNTACATGATASQVYTVLPAGTYYLVLSTNGTGGSATVHFEHLPVGTGTVSYLSRGTTVRSGTTSGTSGYSGTCGGTGPENNYWWVTCPDQATGSFTATTCGRATWNTVLNVLTGSGTGAACNNDSTSPVCAQQSTVTTTIPAGAGLREFILDGYSSASGTYTVLVTRP